MTDVVDLNFIPNDAVEDKISELRHDNDMNVGLIGLSPLLRIIRKRPGVFDQTRDHARCRVAIFPSDISVNTMQIGLRGAGKPDPHTLRWSL